MELKYEKKDVYSKLSKDGLKNVDEYAISFMKFLNTAKTERICVREALVMLKAQGFVDISENENLKLGDKVYFVNKNKSLYVAIIGKNSLKHGINIVGAHIDSPRLDLKPMPLFEKHNAALLKTQYYGGIKKYQWMSIPLAMYGVVFNEKGEKIDIAVGDVDDDITFTITDLLPHLAKDQMKANANDFIDPEKMSVIVGSIKDDKAKSDKVKENILKILNEKYGIKEIDFARSEIEFVPAFKAKYVGLDKSMIGGYGQDDRVCSYSTIRALIDISKENKELNKTAVAMIVDKEEIGSFGNTSMTSETFDMFIEKLIAMNSDKDVSKAELYYNSSMLSADVSTCVDPEWDEVSDVQNGNILGCGIALEKYTGSGGKYNSSDANAEFMSYVMNVFDKNDVSYQMGTLGKIGKGGGGTIAYILASKGVNVVDCGTPILAMHSPFEVSSKFDVYMTYLAYKSFFEE